MLNSETFAKLILSYGSFSNKKLQKLAYYVYSWYLTIYEEKIADIDFEAWVHGPVSPEIYSEYKKYAWHKIPKYEGSIEVNSGLQKCVSAILSEYISKSADELEKMTHEEDPWINARKGTKRNQLCKEIINDQDIIEYYKNVELFNKIQNKIKNKSN